MLRSVRPMTYGTAATVLLMLATIGASITPIRAVAQQTPTMYASSATGPREPQFFLDMGSAKRVPIDVSRTPALTRRISVDLDGVAMRRALTTVAQQGNIKLMYADDAVPLNATVRLQAKSITVAAALTDLLIDAGVDVVFTHPGEATLVRRSVKQEPGVITGKVTDARSGSALASATVAVHGTALGGITGGDGTFRIANVPAGKYTVTARALGFAPSSQTVDVPNGGSVTVNFALSAVATSLDQVVITGTAGGEQRRSIGNAVSTIDAADALSKSAAPDVTSLLNGRVSGMTIAQTTGRLGAGPSVQIRGRSSIGLDNSPLIYIDGVRVNNATGTGPRAVAAASPSFGGASASVAGRLNDISPEDIQSIEIIKGPAASTIYGTEAANGVIQIITRRGQTGDKPQLRVQVQNGAIWFRDAEGRIPTNYLPGPDGEVMLWNAVRAESDSGRTLFKTGQSRLYNAALSGGRNHLTYYASAAYENDLGVEPNNSLRQFSSHVNLNVTANPQLDFGTSLNFVDLSSHLGADNGAGSAMLGAEAGHILLFPASRGFFFTPPEVEQTLWDNVQGINRFTGSGTISNRPADWFSQRLIVGLDYTGDDSRAIERFAPPELAMFLPPFAAAGRIGQTLRHNSMITADYNGTAKFNLTSAFSSSSSIGGQLYRTELNTSSLGGTGFPGPGVETVSAAAQQVNGSQTETVNTTIGAYGQQQFGWHDRLFLTGALRIDNNSAFGEDFKWVTYPKVSSAWVISEEPFWHVGFVNMLKLRAAYGESGRQPAAFSALRTFAPVARPNGQSAVTAGSIGNPDLKPERGKEVELGFEGGLFNRLHVDFTYFTKHTEDEIVAQPLAPSTGFSGTQFFNLGRVDNHGVELQATLQVLTHANLTWEVTGNVATNKDVIKSLGGLPSVIASAGQYNIVGGPIGAFYVKRVVSADRDPATGGATNVLCDGGAGKPAVACEQAPFVFAGTPTPKVSGSVGNTFTIAKRLRLFALVDFKRGQTMFNAVELLRCAGLAGAPLCRANYFPGEVSPTYLAEASAASYAQGIADQFYQDASFVKLREVSVTYTLPERWIPVASSASFTLSARELHTWTGYRGIDPEVNLFNAATSSQAADQAILPPLSHIVASLNLTF